MDKIKGRILFFGFVTIGSGETAGVATMDSSINLHL
jgi:hypothetical protein